MKLVSIIIPTFNGLPWLEEAINSIINQTYDYYEIIIIDDGSNDDTRSFVKNNYYEKVKYFYQNNEGLSSARNFGLKVAKGDYIQFLDSDDILLPEKISNHVKFLDENIDIDIVYSHCLLFEQNKLNQTKDWPNKDLYKNGNLFLSLLKKSYILPHMPLSRKNSLLKSGTFDTNLTSCIDYDYWLKVARSGAKFFFLKGSALVLYRILPGSLSSSHPKHAENGLYVINKIINNEKNDIYINEIINAKGDWQFRYGKSLTEFGERSKGLFYMLKSFLINKSNLDYKITLFLFTLLLGPKNAEALQRYLKYRKDSIIKIFR